eukprot:4944968-Pleurochrysis_carterae.AAC.3
MHATGTCLCTPTSETEGHFAVSMIRARAETRRGNMAELGRLLIAMGDDWARRCEGRLALERVLRRGKQKLPSRGNFELRCGRKVLSQPRNTGGAFPSRGGILQRRWNPGPVEQPGRRRAVSTLRSRHEEDSARSSMCAHKRVSMCSGQSSWSEQKRVCGERLICGGGSCA